MRSPSSSKRSLIAWLALAAGLFFAGSSSVLADRAPGTAGMRAVTTDLDFQTTVSRLEKSIADNKMGLVAQASASAGAAGRGIKIPGNAVLMVFRNDFAVRMLKASIPAGIEAPLRIYVTENGRGSSVSYRTPSATFAPYGNAELDAMAGELDPIFARIVADAVKP